MTPEEKVTQMNERNAAICACYLAGNKPGVVASKFRLGRQRVLQILQAAGAWKPYEKGDRTWFLGVNISEETKAALERRATAEGKSVSRFVSDRLDAAVGE